MFLTSQSLQWLCNVSRHYRFWSNTHWLSESNLIRTCQRRHVHMLGKPRKTCMLYGAAYLWNADTHNTQLPAYVSTYTCLSQHMQMLHQFELINTLPIDNVVSRFCVGSYGRNKYDCPKCLLRFANTLSRANKQPRWSHSGLWAFLITQVLYMYIYIYIHIYIYIFSNEACRG